MRRMREIIGPEERCTNIALESFGICTDRPLMNRAMVYNQLNKKYEVHKYIEIEGVLQAQPIDNFSEILGEEVYGVSTVNNLIEYIKSNAIEGHFVVFVRDHTIAIHSLQGSVFVVDAEERFNSRKRVDSFFYLDETELDKIFANFLKTTEHVNKVEKV